MGRVFTALVFAATTTSLCFAQDSGPGPIAPETSHQYDVTLYRRTTTLDGSLIFTAAGEASGASTTGDLEATIDSQAYSGTWRAYDVGSYAVWAGRAQGDTNSLSVIGWSTPERVIGSATIGSGKGLGALLALLFNRGYYFYGEAAVSEPPPTAAAAN